MALPADNINIERSNPDVNHLVHTPCKYFDIDSFNKLCLANKTGFTIFHHNSRSLIKNFNDITTFISLLSNDFSIIGFTETWFNNRSSPLTHLNNYTLVENHRDERRGGGVCLFVNNNICFKERLDLSIFNESIESIFIEVTETHTKKKMIIGCIYRPPSGSIDDFNFNVQHISNIISHHNYDSYIMGDFNIDLSDVNKSTGFLNLLYSTGFNPTITKPTRITATSATILDNIVTNVESTTIPGILVTDISDHFPIFLLIPTKNNRPMNFMYRRNYKPDNIRRFNYEIENKNWNDVLSQTDVNAAYNTFFESFNYTYNNCFPICYVSKRKRRKKKHPWITTGMLTSIKRKNKLFKSYLTAPTDVNKATYKHYRNKLNHIIRFSKRLYFYDKFKNNRNNISVTWNTINEVLNTNRKKVDILLLLKLVIKKSATRMTLPATLTNIL